MRIIEYMPKYKEQIIDLLIEVAVKEYGFYEWEKWFKIFKNQYYREEGGNCWIALNEKNEVIGTVSLKNRDNGVAEVKNLYIKKEERNKGIATSLFAILLEFAIDNNYTKLKLDTYKEFKSAKPFYENRGFYIDEKDGERYIYELDLNEKISVIVPVYNVENDIENCLDSVLGQDYKNLQIILVDDGSTDNSGKICDKYAKIDERIQVVHKKNGGLADARNVGLEIANGNYIAFLDSDDYIYPTFYKDLYKMVKEHDADIGECEFLRIAIKDKNIVREIIDKAQKKKIFNELISRTEALRLLYGPRLKPYVNKVVVWNKLYKKSILRGITFPVGKLHEDEYTTYKILAKANKIASTNKILHGYMQTPNSIMRQEIKWQRIEDNLDAYMKSSEFFKNNNNKEIEMKSRRRYLENCIELAGKVGRSNGKDKDAQIDRIVELYKTNYDLYIDKIKAEMKDEREAEIIDLIVDAYQKLENIKKNEDNYLDARCKTVIEYWDKLEKIVNKI